VHQLTVVLYELLLGILVPESLVLFIDHTFKHTLDLTEALNDTIRARFKDVCYDVFEVVEVVFLFLGCLFLLLLNLLSLVTVLE
jgi:hypothetical protein